MKKIITRDWIKDDAVFYASNNSKYTKQELCQVIDYCKEKLIEAGAQRGQKVGISLITIDIFYTAVLFAMFELGLKLTILHRMHSDLETKKPKAKAHMPLDIFICYSNRTLTPLSLTTHYYVKNSKKVIETAHEWKLEDVSKAKPTPIWAEPEDHILLCNSSGTTGDPKLIYHNHEYIYDLCSYNWEPMELEDNDTVLHMSSINHGASLSVFYLPALRKCKTHYLDLHKNVDPNKGYPYFLFLAAKDYGINRMLCPNAAVTDAIIDAIEEDDVGLPDTSFVVVSFINPRWLKVIKEGKLKKIISAFGCSETGGPLLVPYIDKDTDENTFNPKFLGKPTVGFYDTKQIDGLLTVDLPNGTRVITEDIVEEKEDGLYFVRKNKLRKINDMDVNPLDIVERIDHLSSRNRFEVVVDEIYNELYIVTDNTLLVAKKEEVKEIVAGIYPIEIRLKDILYMPDFATATVAVKPDREKLLEFIAKTRNA